jgi:CheY-like chemotaxis protein
MAQAEDPADDLATKLAEIKTRFIAGLHTRAKSFRATAEALASGKLEARVMAREMMHRLSGVAGTHGLDALGDKARALEDAIVQDAPSSAIIASLMSIADACEAAAAGSAPPPRRLSDTPPSPLPVPTDASWPEVLVVEDDPATARWICMALERVARCRPIHVGSGGEAREMLGMRTFALVILDGMLPGATGLELLAEIRAESRHGGARVMMLSASQQNALKTALIAPEYDADAWLTKPVPLEILAREVSKLLGRV